MSKSPCKDCKERELGCHSKCDKYIAFKMDKQKQIEEMKNHINNAFDLYHKTGESDITKAIAEELIKYYQPKLPKGSVVLTEERHTALKLIEKYHIKSCGKNSVVLTTEELEEARKETAKELLTDIGNALHDLAIQYSDRGLLSHFTVCEYVRRVLVRKVAKQYGVEV